MADAPTCVALIVLANLVVSDSWSSSSSSLDLLSLLISSNNSSLLELRAGPHSSWPALFLSSVKPKAPTELTDHPVLAKFLEVTNDELTLALSLRQRRDNVGTVVRIGDKHSMTTYLEVQSSGRRDVLRLLYSSTQSRVSVSSVPLQLDDDKWHRLVISLSHTHLLVLVDCRVVHSGLLDAALGPRPASVVLSVGRRHVDDDNFVFEGYLQDVHLMSTPNAHLVECPSALAQCPTCHAFNELSTSVQQLQMEHKAQMELLLSKLEAMESRLRDVEACDCRRSCRAEGGIVHEDGATWTQGPCQICSCVQGEISCRSPTCPSLNCTDPNPPAPDQGLCCPSCKAECRRWGVALDHGASFNPRPCSKCTCDDGRLHCQRIKVHRDCPSLDCDQHLRFTPKGQCCQQCRAEVVGEEDLDCGSCHSEALCLTSDDESRSVQCVCKEGFHGDGHHCQDIDECEEQLEVCNGSHQVCVNEQGSYRCECDQHSRKVEIINNNNNYNISDNKTEVRCESKEDVCAECDLNADCKLINDHFHCQCREGFDGDGLQCRPICDPSCLSDGLCTAPNVCQCPKGLRGPRCELDVDECVENNLDHLCPDPHKQCINTHAGYRCECKEGFWPFRDPRVSNASVVCMDIDECQMNMDTCDHTTNTNVVCVNNEGGYDCVCLQGEETHTQDDPQCTLDCVTADGRRMGDGETLDNCVCVHGRLICHVDNHDYSDSDEDKSCFDKDLKLYIQSGQLWSNKEGLQCQCLSGQVDCWPIPCPSPSDDCQTTPNCDRSSSLCSPKANFPSLDEEHEKV